jgi:hypothetical protein
LTTTQLTPAASEMTPTMNRAKPSSPSAVSTRLG